MLSIHPTIVIILFAFIILFVINIFYKVLVKQNEAKMIKQRAKEMREELKRYQKEGNTEKAKQLMSEMFAENSKLMRMNMKPMIVSFAIVIIFLPFLSGMYTDHNIKFNDNAANITLEKTYQMKKINNTLEFQGQDNSTIACEIPCSQKIDGTRWAISIQGDSVKMSNVVAILPVAFPYVGNDLGWLGWYILASIPLMTIIRRLMKIYT